MCDYSDAYNVVNRRKNVTSTSAANRRNKKLTFDNNAQIRSYISKHNYTFVHNAEDLDILMPMYKNIVIIILWHQEVCVIIIEIK